MWSIFMRNAMAAPHVGRRRLLVVEGAEALQRPGPGPAQGHVLADDVVDPDPVADLCDITVPDPARHGGECRRAYRRAGAPPARCTGTGAGVRSRSSINGTAAITSSTARPPPAASTVSTSAKFVMAPRSVRDAESRLSRRY